MDAQRRLRYFPGCDEEYSRESGTFTKQMGIYPVGSFVRLVSGEMGVVIRVDRGNLLSPWCWSSSMPRVTG